MTQRDANAPRPVPGDPEAGELLLHPLVLCSLGIWIANDHLLKGRAPGWLTGRLSDVACLVVVPVLVGAMLELARPTRRPTTTSRAALRRTRFNAVALGAMIAGGTMVGINLWHVAAAGYRWGLGAAQWPFRYALATLTGTPVPGILPVHLTMDPTDLWTLGSLVLPLWVSRPRAPTAAVDGVLNTMTNSPTPAPNHLATPP